MKKYKRILLRLEYYFWLMESKIALGAAKLIEKIISIVEKKNGQ